MKKSNKKVMIVGGVLLLGVIVFSIYQVGGITQKKREEKKRGEGSEAGAKASCPSGMERKPVFRPQRGIPMMEKMQKYEDERIEEEKRNAPCITTEEANRIRISNTYTDNIP